MPPVSFSGAVQLNALLMPGGCRCTLSPLTCLIEKFCFLKNDNFDDNHDIDFFLILDGKTLLQLEIYKLFIVQKIKIRTRIIAPSDACHSPWQSDILTGPFRSRFNVLLPNIFQFCFEIRSNILNV